MKLHASPRTIPKTIRPDDLAALRALRNPLPAGQDRETAGDGEAASAGSVHALSAGHDDGGEAEQAMTYSAALIEELTAIRTAAMRNELLTRRNLALAVMLYPLVLKTFVYRTRIFRFAVPEQRNGKIRE